MVILPGSLHAVEPGPRPTYVLHSGVHFYLAPPDKNHGARSIREELVRQGVPSEDIVVLDSPFAQATLGEMLPKSSVRLFLQATNPESQPAQDLYLRLDQTLRSLGVAKDSRIVWIGHSAGGQIGMTLAHLGHHLEKFPKLRGKAMPWRFDTVVTLGTPVGSNPVPEGVKLRHFYSPGDSVIQLLVHTGEPLSKSMGMDVRFGPCHALTGDAKVRCFEGIEHHAWIRSPRFVECVLRELKADHRPLWRCGHAECRPMVSLGQLLADCLDEECRISLEDAPGK